MKRTHSIIATATAGALLSLACMPSRAGDLKIIVDHVHSDQGQLIVALYSVGTKDAFPKSPDHAVKKILIPVREAQQGIQFDKLEEGRFAISVVHDENSNGTMDHNFFGMPKEGFGFSNNPSFRFVLPSFEEASFQIDNSAKEIHVSMTYW